MQFAVIYSVDTPGNVNVLEYAPPQVEDWERVRAAVINVYGRRKSKIVRSLV